MRGAYLSQHLRGRIHHVGVYDNSVLHSQKNAFQNNTHFHENAMILFGGC